jgi:hypothetical protein
MQEHPFRVATLAILVLTMATVAIAGQDQPQFRTVRQGNSATLSVSARGVTFEKALGVDVVTVRIAAENDRLELETRASGSITVRRRGVSRTVRVGHATPDAAANIIALLRDSGAARGLGRLVLAVESSNRPEAIAVISSFALLRSLQGDIAGNQLLAERLRQSQSSRPFRPVAQTRAGDTVVEECWIEYERTLTRNLDRYNRCLTDYWWAQPVQYACGIEFAMIAELAVFRLISCTGGLPV